MNARAAVLLLALAGCGPEPAWARRGSGVFHDAGAEVVCGVGVARGIRNEAQRRGVAEDRARGELARALAAHLGANDAFVGGMVAGATVGARAYDASSNTEWVLVSVPLEDARKAWAKPQGTE